LAAVTPGLIRDHVVRHSNRCIVNTM